MANTWKPFTAEELTANVARMLDLPYELVATQPFLHIARIAKARREHPEVIETVGHVIDRCA